MISPSRKKRSLLTTEPRVAAFGVKAAGLEFSVAGVTPARVSRNDARTQLRSVARRTRRPLKSSRSPPLRINYVTSGHGFNRVAKARIWFSPPRLSSRAQPRDLLFASALGGRSFRSDIKRHHTLSRSWVPHTAKLLNTHSSIACTLLNSLASLFAHAFLCFQSFADSFCKIGGWHTHLPNLRASSTRGLPAVFGSPKPSLCSLCLCGKSLRPFPVLS